MMKKILQLLSYILVAVLASVLTFYFCIPQPQTATGPVVQTSSKLDELADLIEERYIDETDRTAMEDAAADAMVESLGDRWSYYIPASDYAAYQEQAANAYVGIGITISVQEDQPGFLITVVNEGGPAEEAGLLVGDVIIAVEGQSTEGMSTTDARNLVRGKEGTFVRITVRRGEEEHTLDVERRQVQTPVATYEMLEGSIGLVTIVNFDARCAEETVYAIETLMDQGAEKLIFDVRFNPGGYASELVKVLDYLLPEGELFRTVNYQGKENVDSSDARCLEIPMAVLVNADSYSAAEFFAAALSEYDAAIVVGQQTSGKGYYQVTYELSDGSAVGLSIGKYYTPKGISLEGVGITPDVPVEVTVEEYSLIYSSALEPEQDPQIQAAITALNGK